MIPLSAGALAVLCLRLPNSCGAKDNFQTQSGLTLPVKQFAGDSKYRRSLLQACRRLWFI